MLKCKQSGNFLDFFGEVRYNESVFLKEGGAKNTMDAGDSEPDRTNTNPNFYRIE